VLGRSGQSANRKEQSVSRKKRCDHQSALAENDQEQQQIGPSSDLQGQLIQVIVQMEKEINGIPLHTKKLGTNPGMFRRSVDRLQPKSFNAKEEKERAAKKNLNGIRPLSV
jgi:hypothetical protein